MIFQIRCLTVRAPLAPAFAVTKYPVNVVNPFPRRLQPACSFSIAPKIGCMPQTLNEWVRRHEVDAGMRDGVSSDERERIKALEREVKELRRANEILKL